MRFEVLGPLTVRGTAEVPLNRQTSRILLGVLLSRAGRPVAVGELIDALWPEDPPPRARKNVQTYVAKLKSELGAPELIDSGPAGYTLRPGPGQLDAENFTTGIERARSAWENEDHAAAEGLVREALAHWRGTPYGGLEECAFLEPERARLTELRLEAAVLRADIGLARGHHAGLVAELTSWHEEHPDHERLTARLMLALYRGDRPQDALTVFRDTKERLEIEYGCDPGDSLQDLHTQILRADPALLPERRQRTAPAAAQSVPAPGGARRLREPTTNTPHPQWLSALLTGSFGPPRRYRVATVVAMGLVLLAAVTGGAAVLSGGPVRDVTADTAADGQGTVVEKHGHDRSSAPATSSTTGSASRPVSPSASGSAHSPSKGTGETVPERDHARSSPPPAEQVPARVGVGGTGGRKSCEETPRIYGSKARLEQMIRSSPEALDDAPEAVRSVRLLVQGTSDRAVVVHGVRVRVVQRREAAGITAFPEPAFPTGCGATLERRVSVDLSRLQPGWNELPTTGPDSPFPLRVTASDPESVLLRLASFSDLRGDYAWEVQIAVSTADGTWWLSPGRTFRASSAPLYEYTSDGEVNPAG